MSTQDRPNVRNPRALDDLTVAQRTTAELAGVVMQMWAGEHPGDVIRSLREEIDEIKLNNPDAHFLSETALTIGILERRIGYIKLYQHILMDLADEVEVIVAKELQWRLTGARGYVP